MCPLSSGVNAMTTDEVDTFHSLEEREEKCQTTESLLGHLDITMQTGMSVVILDVKQECVQSEDSSAVGTGVGLLVRFQKAKSTTFVVSDSYKVNFITKQGGY